jgi:3-oxoacyl-[acyl-carrier protein] reductase
MESQVGSFSDLVDRVAVVTGSSRGVGAGVARELARQGMHVVVHGRDTNAIDHVVASIETNGGDATGCAAELTSLGGVDALRAVTERAYGTPDVLCLFAGGDGNPIAIWDLDPTQWNTTLATNLTSAFLCLRAFLPSLLACGRGSIVTLASTAGRLATLASPAYAAAKAGLLMLTREAALQAAPHGVRVNAIALGPVPEGKDMPQELIDHIAALHPLGRIGTVTDVASLAAFLASDASGWMTGTTIDLSGGHVML